GPQDRRDGGRRTAGRAAGVPPGLLPRENPKALPPRRARPAPRSSLPPCRAAPCRSGRAPRRAPRASAPRPTVRHLARAAGRCLPARAGLLRRSPCLLDPGAEAALGQLDLDALAGLERAAGADDLLTGADDGVAAVERRLRRERPQPPGALLELRAAALDQEPGRPSQALAGAVELLALAVERPARAAFEPRARAV